MFGASPSRPPAASANCRYSNSMPYAVYGIHYSPYRIPYTVYRISYTVYRVPYTVHSITNTAHCIPCTLYPKCRRHLLPGHRAFLRTPGIETPCLIPYDLYRILYTVYRMPCTVYRIPYTVYCIPYTVYCILCVVYRIPYTVYRIPYTVCRIPWTLCPILSMSGASPSRPPGASANCRSLRPKGYRALGIEFAEAPGGLQGDDTLYPIPYNLCHIPEILHPTPYTL